MARVNRNFSSIAVDQTIEVTINKMGKGHEAMTGRCSIQSIDIRSRSYTFRSLLSTITSELAGVESTLKVILNVHKLVWNQIISIYKLYWITLLMRSRYK